MVEDTARFVWDDTKLYKRLRHLRHRLHYLTRTAYKDLVKARDSVSDAGRVIKEGSRSTLEEVVTSNLHRAQEAARVLEEYSKVFSPSSARSFKHIRYRLYQEEKRILKRL